MPSLLEHQSQSAIKLLLAGDSGSGKTGSLVSLVPAGYHLRILDFDNGLDILVNGLREYAKKKALSPDAVKELFSRVHYATLTDKFKSQNGVLVTDGIPSAFSRAMNLLSNWKTETEDFGPVTSWGPEAVLVIDSSTFMASAAYRWLEYLGVGKGKHGVEPRQIFFEAQKKVADCLSLLYSDSVKCNVVFIAHLRYMEMPDGTKKGYPTSVGEAQGPQIPRFFNSFLQVKTLPGGRRVISAKPTGLVDLKLPIISGVPDDVPIEDGLAKYFEILKGKIL